MREPPKSDRSVIRYEVLSACRRYVDLFQRCAIEVAAPRNSRKLLRVMEITTNLRKKRNNGHRILMGPLPRATLLVSLCSGVVRMKVFPIDFVLVIGHGQKHRRGSPNDRKHSRGFIDSEPQSPARQAQRQPHP
jgi:hypothetical protein